MKINRLQLKKLIKECLAEILTEGLGQSLEEARTYHVAPERIDENKRSAPRQQQPYQKNRQYDPALDTPIGQLRGPSSALQNAVKESAGGNKLMESIFADTAANTLQQQLSNGDNMAAIPTSGTPPLSQVEQFSGTPEQIFGDAAASKWAALAFMDNSKKKVM